MTNETTPTNTTDISSPAYKRKRETEEEAPTRLEEQFVPLYKAYRKANINVAKASHHHKTLSDFSAQSKIPKAFKINIKPQIPNPTTDFIIEWETAASQFGHSLVNILVRYWETQKSNSEKEVNELEQRLQSVPSEQRTVIKQITSRIVESTLGAYKEKWRKEKSDVAGSGNLNQQ